MIAIALNVIVIQGMSQYGLLAVGGSIPPAPTNVLAVQRDIATTRATAATTSSGIGQKRIGSVPPACRVALAKRCSPQQPDNRMGPAGT
jgi:hypothetical protein